MILKYITLNGSASYLVPGLFLALQLIVSLIRLLYLEGKKNIVICENRFEVAQQGTETRKIWPCPLRI